MILLLLTFKLQYASWCGHSFCLPWRLYSNNWLAFFKLQKVAENQCSQNSFFLTWRAVTEILISSKSQKVTINVLKRLVTLIILTFTVKSLLSWTIVISNFIVLIMYRPDKSSLNIVFYLYPMIYHCNTNIWQYSSREMRPGQLQTPE